MIFKELFNCFVLTLNNFWFIILFDSCSNQNFSELISDQCFWRKIFRNLLGPVICHNVKHGICISKLKIYIVNDSSLLRHKVSKAIQRNLVHIVHYSKSCLIPVNVLNNLVIIFDILNQIGIWIFFLFFSLLFFWNIRKLNPL